MRRPRAIHRAAPLRARAGEVEGDRIALDAHRHADWEGLVVDPVAVDEVLGLVDAVGERKNRRAAQALAAVQHVAKRLLGQRRSVFFANLQDPRLGDAHRGQLGVQVAQAHLGNSRIGGDQIDQVLAALARIVDALAGKARALMEDLGRVHRQRARDLAADVGPVRDGDGVGDDLAVHENRFDDGDVGKMRAALVGIVRDIDVAGPHGAAKTADNVLDVTGEGAGEYGDAVGLGDHLCLGVDDAAGEVQYLIDHRAHRGSRQNHAHLDGRRQKLAADDLERDALLRRRSVPSLHVALASSEILLKHAG